MPIRPTIHGCIRHSRRPQILIDFLVPCRQTFKNPAFSYRLQHSIAAGHSSVSENDRASQNASRDQIRRSPSDKRRPLSDEQRRFLDRALRVNQAGELAAVLIYTAQTPHLVRRHPHLRSLMNHMYDQEASHFATFNSLLFKHRIRPTAMYPVWKIAATALGWSTALMGREAAMACTEAVETEIGQHYNEQVRTLLSWAEEVDGEVGEEMEDLLKTLRRIRDEELEHLDHAVMNDAHKAQPYGLLTNVIRGGCRTAIWISERV